MLDIGCGTQPHGDVNLDIDRRLYSLEWKQKMPANLVIADAKNLPFREETFEKVGCYVSLPYVGDERKALFEVNRVLKPAGQLFISHHTLAFYLKFSFVHASNSSKFKKEINSPLVRFVDMSLKIPAYIFMHNRTPHWIKSMGTFQTRKGIAKLLEDSFFEVQRVQQRKQWKLWQTHIDAVAAKKGTACMKTRMKRQATHA